MGVCDDILKKDIVPSCDDPVVQGLEQEGVIMNRADVDFAATVFNSTKKNVIETLAMKTGKKAYKVVVPGKNPFTGTKTSLVAGTYRSSFTNTVAIVILANDPDVCADVIDGLANGTYVVVLENKYKGLQKEGNPGDAAFQVYGYYQGLTATAIDNDKYSEDTEGGWAVTLEEQKTPKSALFLFKTSYEATKTAVNTLTAEPGSIGGNMLVLEVVDKLKRLGDKVSLSSSDKSDIELMFHEVLGRTFIKTSCGDCYRDAVIEMYSYLKRYGKMKEKSSYALKNGVLLQVGFGSSEMYTNNNLTDEAAERYLAENPKGIVFFASTPSDWEKRVERRMTPALPLDETLVSELVKAFEVEGATSEIVRDAFKTYKLNGKKVTAKVLDAHIKEAQSVVGSKQTTEAVETVE